MDEKTISSQLFTKNGKFEIIKNLNKHKIMFIPLFKTRHCLLIIKQTLLFNTIPTMKLQKRMLLQVNSPPSPHLCNYILFIKNTKKIKL